MQSRCIGSLSAQAPHTIPKPLSVKFRENVRTKENLHGNVVEVSLGAYVRARVCPWLIHVFMCTLGYKHLLQGIYSST